VYSPYENLPLDYARIFQFEDYRRTRGRVLKTVEEDGKKEGIEVGKRVTIWIKNVPKAVYGKFDISSFFF
jgi:pre-rRNA-processing protein TSR1